MAEEYVKTSAEELTAMAEYLRQNGDFEEGQKFIFPSSEYDQDPVYTYKIVDNGAWEEITATEASQLIEQSGYSIEQVSEFPDIQEALANTIYYKIELGTGFKEAYQKYLDDFYDKIMYGTLKQEDLDGVVFSEPLKFFIGRGSTTEYKSFPNITEITIDGAVLAQTGFAALGSLEKVNVIKNSENCTVVNNAFRKLELLEEINLKPALINTLAFQGCHKLKFGEGYLDLSECTYYGNSCLADCSITTVSIAEGATIESQAFRNSNLKNIYLPDRPPELANIDAFDNIDPDFTFYVSTDDVISVYLSQAATTWRAFDSSKFRSLTQG